MNKTLCFIGVITILVSCSNAKTESSKEQTELTETYIETVERESVSENLPNEKTEEIKTFNNESLIGDWTYKKNVTTVGTEVIELVVTDNWQLKFDGVNCTDIQDSEDAQINPYVIEGDSLIFTELRFISKKIVEITDSLLILGQDVHTVLHFTKM